jgi:iron complex outermembrane receptor protein
MLFVILRDNCDKDRDERFTMKHRTAPRRQDLSRTATAIAVSLLCSAAHGQTSNADQTPEATSLTRVIVTANKREQASIDVPASVSTVSAERLALGGATRLEDFVSQVPGLAVTAMTRGQTVVTLRGIGTGAAQAVPTTAQYIDDAPIGSINAYAAGSKVTPDLDPSDLRRVEVLKGPQGTAYGAGAVGGLVRYVTIPANTRTFSGVVQAGVSQIEGGGKGNNLRAALNIPVTQDVLGIRISAFDRTEGGYIDNPVTGQDGVNEARTKGGRLAMDLKINQDWSLRAWALTQHFKSDGLGSEDVTAPGLAPLNQPMQRISYVKELQDIKLDVANITLRGKLGGFDVVSSSTYQTSKLHRVNDNTVGSTGLLRLLTGMPGLGAYTNAHIDTRRVSQELRARSAAFDDRLEYEVGLFWTRENDMLDSQLPPPFFYATGKPITATPLGNGTIGSAYKEISYFGNLSYAVTSQLSALAGIRRATDNQKFDLDYKASVLSPVPVRLLQDVDHGKTTYMAGINYKPQPDTSLYGRVATGYRAGGPSALPPGALPDGKLSFEPDTLTSYELGFKSAFLNGKASVEAAVFTTNWQDIQLMATAPARPPFTYTSFNYGTNGGSARSKGAEATFLYSPVNAWTMRANAAYTDTHLTSAAPAVGGLSGDALPYIPKWSMSVSAEYRFAVGAAQSWVGGSFGRVGERISDYSLKKPLMLAGYNNLTLNAGADWKNVRISLYGKNLTNARGINFAGPIADQSAANPYGNPYTVALIQPRTFGVDLSYRF